MPRRIIDVSSAQHPNRVRIDWEQAKADGVTTVLIKATEGPGYVNPYWAGGNGLQSDRDDALSAGIDVLAYHYAAFGNPAYEAQRFAAIAGRYARILDVETSTDVAWFNAFFVALGLGVTECMTYGSASSLGINRGSTNSLLWPAAYGQGWPGWGQMWQFTDKATVPGIATAVDESSWHGTQAEYDTLFMKNQPQHEEDPLFYMTRSDGVGFVTNLLTKRGITSADEAARIIATGQVTVIPKGQWPDAEIDAIPG